MINWKEIYEKTLRDICEEDENYFGIIRQKDNNGKDTIIISKNIENAYLSVETPYILLNKTTNYNIFF